MKTQSTILSSALFVVCAFALSASARDAAYSSQFKDYTVYRVTVQNEQQVKLLDAIKQSNDQKVDFWSEPHRFSNWTDMMIEPSLKQEFEQTLAANQMPFQVQIADLAAAIEQSVSENTARKNLGKRLRTSLSADTFDYSVYHTLAEIEQWIDLIKAKYPNYVNVFNVSRSYEGRTIRALKISVGGGDKKPAIWIDSGLHAREWVTVSTVLFMTNEFLSKYGKDSQVTELLNHFDLYFLPVFNPDGYHYTHTTDRMWRKTRKPNRNSVCVGVDPNRNWDSHHCEQGASTNPCSDTYCGPTPFSESELKYVADFLKANKDTIVSYMNIHAYSQYWMTPYGYTADKPKHFTYQMEGGRRVANAIKSVYGTQYQVGNVAEIIYLASGSSADWAYDDLGIIFSYGVELRDTGRYGFLLPPSQILPTGKETFEGIKALAYYIKSNPVKTE